MEHALQSPSLSSLRATVQGAEPWNEINNVLSFGSTLLILGVSNYEQSPFHISCSSNHCTCKRMQKKRKESILMLRLMGAAPKECKRNYFDYEVLHSQKSHLSSLSRYAERRRSKGWRTIMKEAGLKLDNYFQAVEKTPIFMQVWFDFVGKKTDE